MSSYALTRTAGAAAALALGFSAIAVVSAQAAPGTVRLPQCGEVNEGLQACIDLANRKITGTGHGNGSRIVIQRYNNNEPPCIPSRPCQEDGKTIERANLPSGDYQVLFYREIDNTVAVSPIVKWN